MRAIEILSEEHALLRRVLDCLEELVQETVRCDCLDGEAAAEILELLARFADGCHQDKEEVGLFHALMNHAPAHVREKVRELFHIHGEERELLEELRGAFEAAAYGEPLSQDLFVCRCQNYVELQRSHAKQEDDTLFPLAERWLSAEVDAEIVQAFETVDQTYRQRYSTDSRAAAAALFRRFENCSAPTASTGKPEAA